MDKLTYLFLAGALWACGSSAPEGKTTSETTNNTENTVIDEKNTGTASTSQEEIISNTDKAAKLHLIYTYKGQINEKLDIIMKFNWRGSDFDGYYKYKGKDQTLTLTKKLEDGNEFTFEESVYSEGGYKVTGSFKGAFNGPTFAGTWTSADGSKSFPFSTQRTVERFNFSSTVEMEEGIMTYSILDMNNQEIQKIEVEQSMMPDSSIVVEDMNFDGYLDMRMTGLVAMNGNTNYSSWLYNPSLGKFEYNKVLSGLVDPYFETEKKQVHSTWKSGYAHYGHETYLYQDGNYFLIESGTTDMDAEGNEKTTTTKHKIVNGKSVEVK